MKKRFRTYLSDSNDYSDNPIRFVEEGQSLPDDWYEYVWQYAKDGAEAISQHDEKMNQWKDDMDAGLPEKDTY